MNKNNLDIVNSAENIRALDKYCTEELCIPSLVLMENAALSFVYNIPKNKYKEYIMLCGKGNNGGDGLAIGRKLLSQGNTVKFIILHVGRESEDFISNFNIIKNMGCTICEVYEEQDIQFISAMFQSDVLVVDGIFGTGLNREVKGVAKVVIEVLNRSKSDVYSIDIPSGLQCDTGEILGVAVKAEKTISFAMYKFGFLNYEAFEYIGKVVLQNIGMPPCALEKYDSKCYMVNEDYVKSNFHKRKATSHKGDFGKLLIFAGSSGFAGAAKICARAAVRCGAGLTYVVCHEEVLQALSSSLTEPMCMTFQDERVANLLGKSTVIAFGPGMGDSDITYRQLKYVVENSNAPMVIDADGLNVLCNHKELLKKRPGFKTIITPHPGEMSRLTGKDISYVEKNRIDVACKFAREYEVVVLLKGHNTVITDGNTVFINTSGNSAMANGGMGDCLTGIIASFIGQGYNELKAAVMGAYIHGYIGDYMAQYNYVVTAEDIIGQLSKTLREFTD
ncbi:NAD(P)H-hydrate epimerase [Hathewaya proteolytica DSM 3090]|uniref:Bifunctional NAD(P)H-hydrate repair enzyme n=1 Tax=Hathewaya proteolytica DSM 3090 TaxID=1121331 RepID=A0A1M6NEJ5_9CLOT|nr:NAD(P)H-hydrate dehydratase [Hathewaya proteolytica]SHJ94097.1 NAD(P)H-hydrate epimerase [Hathewaya proteolytica DSM 3090]